MANEVRPCGVPRWRFAYFAATGKVGRRRGGETPLQQKSLPHAGNEQHPPGGQTPLLQLVGLEDLLHGGAVALGQLPQALSGLGQAEDHRGLVPLSPGPGLAQGGAAHGGELPLLQHQALELQVEAHLHPSGGGGGKSAEDLGEGHHGLGADLRGVQLGGRKARLHLDVVALAGIREVIAPVPPALQVAPAEHLAGVKRLGAALKEAAPVLNRQTGVLREGAEFTVVDMETDAMFHVVRKGGSNHIDFEPLTEDDTEVMLAICGEWSWDRRAVWVVVDNSVYAASINCMPHGSASVEDNGYPGHSCMHFTGSKTHGSNRVDEAHQAAVQTALETPFKEGSHG